MKKIYTKKQITEAIRYWSKQLQLMNEAQSAILNALEKEFGKTIYDNNLFIPTNNVMNKVFDILNATLFSNQLPKIDVMCLSAEKIQNIFDKHNHKRNANELHAVYFPLPDFTKINFARKNQFPKIHYLMINTTTDYNMNFAFAVNSLCHEMIHYLDTIKGDLLLKWKIAYDNKRLKDFDEHKTDIFMKKEKQFNKEGLTIIPNDGGFSQKDLNDFSLMRMKKLQEMEDVLLDPLKSKSHMVATDLGDGRFAISF